MQACNNLDVFRVGRRWPLFFFHVIGGIVCVAAAFIPKETGMTSSK